MWKEPACGAADWLLKPIEFKRLARLPYQTGIRWIEVGHARAGVLPSIDRAEPGKRHSYRIRVENREGFHLRLTMTPNAVLASRPVPPPTARPAGDAFRW